MKGIPEKEELNSSKQLLARLKAVEEKQASLVEER